MSVSAGGAIFDPVGAAAAVVVVSAAAVVVGAAVVAAAVVEGAASGECHDPGEHAAPTRIEFSGLLPDLEEDLLLNVKENQPLRRACCFFETFPFLCVKILFLPHKKATKRPINNPDVFYLKHTFKIVKFFGKKKILSIMVTLN